MRAYRRLVLLSVSTALFSSGVAHADIAPIPKPPSDTPPSGTVAPLVRPHVKTTVAVTAAPAATTRSSVAATASDVRAHDDRQRRVLQRRPRYDARAPASATGGHGAAEAPSAIARLLPTPLGLVGIHESLPVRGGLARLAARRDRPAGIGRGLPARRGSSGQSPDGSGRRASARALTAPLSTIAREWTRLGFTGFGGPPAHVALLRKLVVERRRWMDAQEFEDANAACGLLPGPASTQLAIFCAYRVGGPPGAIVGGLGFVVPAVVLVLLLSVLFLGSAPPLWVRGAGAGAGAAVAAVAVNAGRSLLAPSFARVRVARAPALRWAPTWLPRPRAQRCSSRIW